MAGFQTSDTMPKLGHVTDLREQWVVRTDVALAHRLQDREISSHLTENRSRNQQIREDFPLALSEQQVLEHEARAREHARLRQAALDADIAREMAEINLRRQRRRHPAEPFAQPSSSRAPVDTATAAATPATPTIQNKSPADIYPDELGLSPTELEEMRKRLEQEERDARLARELSHEEHGHDALLADMKYAVEAQDGELARLLQEREYKKLQRAKEKARQKAFLKKQQRLSQQCDPVPSPSDVQNTQATLLDAYSNPRDLIRDQHGARLCKSVDSDLNYVEPFEKEHIQSKASALKSREMSRQYYKNNESFTNNSDTSNGHDNTDNIMPNSHSLSGMQHRQPPPPPAVGKKPRFPDPISIRPASHYPADGTEMETSLSIPHSYSENNNMYNSTFPPDYISSTTQSPIHSRSDPSKRLSVISDITAEGLAKKKNKQESKKRKGCKIQ